jgi:protein-S-isoprenylcysteine O-methyltransferase Ste14
LQALEPGAGTHGSVRGFTQRNRSKTSVVIAWLVPAIAVGMAQRLIIGMAGTSPAMTKRNGREFCPCYYPYASMPLAAEWSIQMNALTKRALIRTLEFSAFVGVLVIVPAGPAFWQGWLYWFVFSLCSLALALYFLQHDPALMERRLRAKAEQEASQKVIRALLIALLVPLYVIPGIDHRHGWSHVPGLVVIVANAVVVLGFVIIFMTFKANSHASAIIDVTPDQRVVSTGPYAIVRHPMYLGAALLLLATPFALGSVWAIIFALMAIGCLVWRLLDEERYLSQHLPGYDGYRRMTRYRLIPFIW